MLPRLPVPDLRKTLDRYLASLEPLLLEDEIRGGMPFEDSHTLRIKLAKEFESGIGKVLQERLIGTYRPGVWLLRMLNVMKLLIELLHITGLMTISG